MSTKRGNLVFRCSPELADGYSWTIAETPKQLAEFVRIWAEEHQDDELATFDVEVVLMSREEIDSLPDL